MLNGIWACMILLGIVYAFFTGNIQGISDAFLDSAGEAVSLCITMAGVVALWMGLMRIATEAGLIQKMTKGIEPFLNFLFPDIPKNHPAREYIATNLVANILGLGWACTPAGLKEMEELSRLEKERQAAASASASKSPKEISCSNEMCNFLILNISSLQLIPVNMIAYRSQYGSHNPTQIIMPAILATTFSTLVAILYCKWKDRRCQRCH